MKCSCGGELVQELDFIYDIIYFKCVVCGRVKFDDSDGFGILKMSIPYLEKTYRKYCKFCNSWYLSKSPNRKCCYNEKCIKEREEERCQKD